MDKNKSGNFLILILVVFILVLSGFYGAYTRIYAQSDKSVKFGTFEIPTGDIKEPLNPVDPSPTPLSTIMPSVSVYNALVTNSPITPKGLITGGPVSPTDPYYCIDDEAPDGCDDNTAFWVPKGTGGISGSCGTVIENGHKLVNSLPQALKGTRDSLNPEISNCGYSTGAYSSGYISTFFVIDAFNLAGYTQLNKSNPAHVRGFDLLSWWQSAEAATAGYKFVPYSTSALQQHASGGQSLTGCVVFLNISSGVHVGLMNALEIVDTHGNGIFSILQSGVSFYIDRFEVVNWGITNTPLHKTNLQSVAGFGCHN